MTPKEKAQELFAKYEFVYIPNYTSKHEVKQCALIAVDEIIESDENEHPSDIKIDFWQEVKEELEKL